jgi:hypothetical protein
MNSRFSPITFAIVFSCAYALAFWFNQPLFLYYPLYGDFNWGPAVMKNAGPGMAWYGLMSDALIAATVLALIVPDRIFDRLLRGYLGVFPLVAMLVCVYLVRNFFLVS